MRGGRRQWNAVRAITANRRCAAGISSTIAVATSTANVFQTSRKALQVFPVDMMLKNVSSAEALVTDATNVLLTSVNPFVIL